MPVVVYYLEKVMADFRPCAVIPVYNHEHAIGAVVQGVLAHQLPCILVDDASSAACAQTLDALASDRVTVVRHAYNQGKGGAVMTGFKQAAAQGYTHVLQIDADGQHDVNDIPQFLALSQKQPRAMIIGCPRYDESVPKARLYGRYLTHIWIWINTLSLQIKDSMCGFRVYPLPPVLALLQRRTLGQRMDFDPEIVVRLHWAGVQCINVPTPVGYPTDGVSHFKLWLDNALISRMHARLFFGMLCRLPLLLFSKVRAAA